MESKQAHLRLCKLGPGIAINEVIFISKVILIFDVIFIFKFD